MKEPYLSIDQVHRSWGDVVGRERAAEVILLFKDNDFRQTDIELV